MESNPLLALPEGMQIDQIQASQNEVSITVIATHPTSCCPLCSHPSSSIHSRYCRTVRNAPCSGRNVQLTLCVRKFFCRNPLCARKVFTERLPDLVRPWAKMTIRYCEQITSVGLATCGKGGTRLARVHRICSQPRGAGALSNTQYLSLYEASKQEGSQRQNLFRTRSSVGLSHTETRGSPAQRDAAPRGGRNQISARTARHGAA